MDDNIAQPRSKNKGKKRNHATKRGREASYGVPKTSLAKRLQQVIPAEKKVEVAKELGIQPRTLTKYAEGEGIPAPADVLARISKITGCDANWLLKGEGEPFPHFRPATDMPFIIPMAGRAAADESGGTCVDFEHDAYCEPDVGFENITITSEIAYIEVQSNSMAPLAYKGQQVLIDLNPSRTIHDGDLVVVQTSAGATFFKRFYQDDDKGYLVLNSFNPINHVKPIRLKWDEVNRIHVVVGVWFG